MIDHVSLGVRDLAASEQFYQPVLATLGFSKLVTREGTVGFGKKYPEFWLNARPALSGIAAESGTHTCLRAGTTEAVDAFHSQALANGGTSDGAPGLRPHYNVAYYAAFIRDPDGHRIEAVTFLDARRTA